MNDIEHWADRSVPMSEILSKVVGLLTACEDDHTGELVAEYAADWNEADWARVAMFISSYFVSWTEKVDVDLIELVSCLVESAEELRVRGL